MKRTNGWILRLTTIIFIKLKQTTKKIKPTCHLRKETNTQKHKSTKKLKREKQTQSETQNENLRERDC